MPAKGLTVENLECTINETCQVNLILNCVSLIVDHSIAINTVYLDFHKEFIKYF